MKIFLNCLLFKKQFPIHQINFCIAKRGIVTNLNPITSEDYVIHSALVGTCQPDGHTLRLSLNANNLCDKINCQMGLIYLIHDYTRQLKFKTYSQQIMQVKNLTFFHPDNIPTLYFEDYIDKKV